MTSTCSSSRIPTVPPLVTFSNLISGLRILIVVFLCTQHLVHKSTRNAFIKLYQVSSVLPSFCSAAFNGSRRKSKLVTNTKTRFVTLECICRGTTITQNGTSSAVIKARNRLGRKANVLLNDILWDKNVTNKNKSTYFNNFCCILLYTAVDVYRQTLRRTAFHFKVA